MQDWIVPCNTKYYNVEEAFKNLPRLDWKQSSDKYEIGDDVYIYISAPISAVRYKCRVTRINLKTVEIDDSCYIIDSTNYRNQKRYMELELLERLDISYSELQRRGLKGRIQCQRRAGNLFR